MLKRIEIGFLHIFKCGGTTFNWILEKNARQKCLYIETKTGKRLTRRDVIHAIEENFPAGLKAISSHNIDSDVILKTRFPFTFIRDPLKRMWSAYTFEKFQQKINPQETFLEFSSKNSNFQSRVLGQEKMNPFEICEKYNIGILEKFDYSMIGFETVLNAHSLDYDLSYDLPKNINNTKKIDDQEQILFLEEQEDYLNKNKARLVEENKDDYLLLNLGSIKLEGILSTIYDKEKKLKDFKDRCAKLNEEKIVIKSYGQGPKHFTYI